MKDYYVCPMGQHMTLVGVTRKVSGNSFASYSHRYRAQRCTGCPLRSQCYKSKAEQRTIEVNHNLNEHKRKAREMLTFPALSLEVAQFDFTEPSSKWKYKDIKIGK